MTPRLSQPTELKFAAPLAETGEFSGYASTFNGSPDAYGDVIAPRAFANSLAEHKSRDTMPALLWSHDASAPIGVWTTLREDDNGLRVTGKLTLGVQRADEAHALMKAGAVALSIGYIVREADRDARGARVLKQVDLIEVSLVAIPANTDARITSVKSALAPDDIRTPREFERLLRDVGFSRAFAVAATNHGFKTAAGLREADDAVDAMAADIRRRAETLNQLLKGYHDGTERPESGLRQLLRSHRQ